jgi:hypothetical protein
MRRIFALLALVFVSCMGAVAQSNTEGGITGGVSDATGAVLPGIVVTATSEATNATISAQTDSTGRFLIQHLQPGVYNISIQATGFAGFRETNVVVEVGLVTPIEVKLTLASQSQQITVTAETTPLINTEQSVFGHNFNTTDLNNLPMNIRRWSYVALLTPGAVPDGTFGDVAFRGVGYIFDNNTIDGAANTQAFFAEEVGRTRMAYSTSMTSVQEFQVTTSNYSAEYGRAVGGVINAVTKSGSNQLHGDLVYYNRDNSVGGAFTPFATGAVQQPDGNFVTEPIKPTDIRQQMSADIGGPIVKNKLFFYFDFDDQIHHFPAVNIPSTPANFFAAINVAAPTGGCPASATLSGSAEGKLTIGQVLDCRGFTQAQANAGLGFLTSTTGRSPRTGDQTIFFPKLDWHPTQNNTISASYNRVRWTSPYGVQTGSVVARSIDSNGNDYVHDNRAVASWTSVLGGSRVNEARFIYSQDNEFEFKTASLATEPVAPQTGFSPQVDINGCGFSTSAATLSCSWTLGTPYYLDRPAYPNERRYQGMDSFSFVKGNHSVKLGVDITHTGDFLQSYAAGDQFGEFSYTYMQDFISDYLSAVDHTPLACTSTNAGTTYQIPCYNDYFQTFGPLAFNVDTLEPSFFVQDDWHVAPRLTLNLGLRWDHQNFPSPVLPNSTVPQTTSFPSDNKDFAPRFGFAYDISGNGKTVVRGGYGMFYGRITNEQIYEELTLTGVTNSQINATIFPTTGSSNSTGTPTPGLPIYPNILPTYNPSVGKPNIVYFPSDLRLPGAEEFDAVVEHQVAPNTAISVSYIGSVGRFLPIGLDTNLPAPTTVNYTITGGGPFAGGFQSIAYPFFMGARPNGNFQKMVEYCSCVTSHYNAFVAQVNRRFTGGLQFSFSYTYSHGTDDGASSNAAITSNGPINPFNLGLEQGISYLNVPNRFIGSVVYAPHFFEDSSSHLARTALAGWEVSLGQTAETGTPYSASISGNEPSGLNATVSAGGPTGAGTSTRVVFLKKDGYRLPPTVNTDLMLAKNFRMTEHSTFQISVQAFNLFNHQDYTAATATAFTAGGTAANPTLSYNSTFDTHAALTAANNGVFIGARQLQFGAKITF